MPTDRKNGRNTAGRFGPGNSGKPKGARHKLSVALESLLEGQAEALTQRCIDAALAGDMAALRLCMERIAPARRERLVRFKLPPIYSARDVPLALSTIIKATAAGELTTGEAANLAALLDRFRAAYELSEIDARLTALEQREQAAPQMRQGLR